jgi:hypothetical protein
MTVPTALRPTKTTYFEKLVSRRWCSPRVLAIFAITAGSLGISTAAFATQSSTASAGTTPVLKIVTDSTYPDEAVIATEGPVIVFVSDRAQNVVELTSSGALVVLLRYIPFVPVVRHEVALPIKRTSATAAEVTSVLTTTEPRKHHHAWFTGDYFYRRWSGDPNGSWGHCDGDPGASPKQSPSFADWYSDLGGNGREGWQGGYRNPGWYGHR